MAVGTLRVTQLCWPATSAGPPHPALLAFESILLAVRDHKRPVDRTRETGLGGCNFCTNDFHSVPGTIRSRVSRIEEAIFNKKEFDNKARISASCNNKNANVGRHERVIMFFYVSKPALKRDNLFCVIALHVNVKNN
jgi:hypothetical protein